MSLIRGVFWLALFLFFTFCFVVLFEYGTHDFMNGFRQESDRIVGFVKQQIGKPKPAAEKPKR